MSVKAKRGGLPRRLPMEWQPIAAARFGRDLELAAISNAAGMQALVFPCRRVPDGWVKIETGAPVKVRPTQWRAWVDPAPPSRLH